MWTLAKRNFKLYIFDKTAVFFSFLGALIAILLVGIFLRSSFLDQLTDAYGGLVAEAQAGHIIDTWLIASACVIAAATTGLSGLGQFVNDRETARWRDFLVTPLPRWSITGGYILAATMVSMVMTSVVYTLGSVYCLANGTPLGAGDAVKGWLLLMLCCAGFTSLMGFIVSLLRTMSAFTSLSIVVGVLFGFLSETYVSRGGLPTSVSNVLSWLPFAQATALVREPFTAAAVAALPAEAQQATIDAMGLSTATLGFAPATIAAVLAGMTLLGSALAWQVMARTVNR